MPQPLWLWAILGLVLLSIELLTGTFYILWFGIEALCVALMLGLHPDASLSVQLLAFSVLSLTTLAIWRARYRQARPGSQVGQSRDDTIGKVGKVTQAVSASQQGMIRFTVPVMSSREWNPRGRCHCCRRRGRSHRHRRQLPARQTHPTPNLHTGNHHGIVSIVLLFCWPLPLARHPHRRKAKNGSSAGRFSSVCCLVSTSSRSWTRCVTRSPPRTSSSTCQSRK